MRKAILVTLLVSSVVVTGPMLSQGDNPAFLPLMGVETLMVAPPPFYHYKGIKAFPLRSGGFMAATMVVVFTSGQALEDYLKIELLLDLADIEPGKFTY